MNTVKKAATITLVAGGLVAAGAGVATADSGAQGAALNSPGVLSGNTVQVPVHVPVNLCGNSVNVIGAVNPAFGNVCINDSGDHKGKDHKGKQHGHGQQGHAGR